MILNVSPLLSRPCRVRSQTLNFRVEEAAATAAEMARQEMKKTAVETKNEIGGCRRIRFAYRC